MKVIKDIDLNFFVVGAAKGGTTTVFERLNSRPDVYLSPLKEPNYYSTDIDVSKFSAEFRANTRLDLTEYFSTSPLPILQIGFVRDSKQYASLFENAPSDVLIKGECSTSYLWSKAAPQELKKDHPSARILIMLRNPIDRLFSHYMMARKYGFTSLPLIEAVEKDLAHPNPGWGSSELFVELGLYSDQIARWKAEFPTSSIKIVLTEDLRSQEKWDEVLEWLNLPKRSISSGEKQDANTAGLPRFEKLNRFLTSHGLKHRLGNLLPAGLKRKFVAWYYNSENLPKITPEEREHLHKIYASEIMRLKEEHGIEVDHWK
jgi:hypothetical protein